MTQPAGTRHPLRPTTVLYAAVALVTVVWLLIVLVWRPAPFSLTFDDAFYYFGIARNLAHGHGSTFDGIDPTNGYHPLWLLVATVPYLLGSDGTGAARSLLVVQVVCYGGALALVARTAGRAIDGWSRALAVRPDDGPRLARWCTAVVAVGLFAVAADPFVVKTFVNGMESGLLVLTDALVLSVGAARRGRFLGSGRARDRWLLGVLLALTFLTRTDSVALLAVLGLWSLAEARGAWARSVWPLVQLFAIPTATVGLYLISNQIWFGTWLQVSGLTKRAPLTVTSAGVIFLVGVAVAVLCSWGFRRCHTPRRRSRFGRVAEFTSSTAWFAGFCLLIITYYQVLQTQQWLWYYSPALLYLIFVLVLAVADFVEGAVAEAPAQQSAARPLAVIGLILLVPLVAAGVYEGRQIADPHSYSLALADRDAGQWISRNLPPGTVLGSWDAGVIGYYAHRPVINLDGVANSYAYYQANRRGTVGQFLADRGMSGTANLGTPTGGQDTSIKPFVERLFGRDAAAKLRLRRSWPFWYSGSTTGAAGTKAGGRRLAIFLYLFTRPNTNSH